MKYEYDSIIDCLYKHALASPNKIVFRFLDDDAAPLEITYRHLYQHAYAIANTLIDQGLRNSRVLMLYPNSYDFIVNFLGCLIAEVIALPSDLPKSNRVSLRIDAIIKDSQPQAILTTNHVLKRLEKSLPQDSILKAQTFHTTDTIPYQQDLQASPNIPPPPKRTQEIAFLQYTSGSTSAPKGVIITHQNILANEAMIREAFQVTADTVNVGWLPFYHDMGLVGNVLQVIYSGCCSNLMPPLTFLLNPKNWLDAITKYRATVSGGPNFAYDLCTDRIKDIRDLDLSSWQVAFCGSERIRTTSLERFYQHFKPCGFSKKAYLPCYGLAEATLIVTGAPVGREPRIKQRKIKGQQYRYISCGSPLLDTQIRIIDPETRRAKKDGEIGEVILSGDSLFFGYWNRADLNPHIFNLDTDNDFIGYFRTGDLGFIEDGELYLVDRLKDMLIIGGSNYYPRDIEGLVSEDQEGLVAHATAAFSVDIDGKERLILVQEVKRHAKIDYPSVAREIKSRIYANLELNLYEILFIHVMHLPRTSSGKIKRYQCREKYLQDSFKVIEAVKFAKK